MDGGREMSHATPRERPTEAEIHTLLCNERRRRVIEELRTRLGGATLRGLAETIAAIETDESPPPRKARESVYNSLSQTHLPKLHDLGVVEYDKHRKTVELGDHAPQVDVYMEVLSPYGITWAQYYRVVAVAGLVTVVGLESGVVWPSNPPVLLVASAFLLLLAVSTLYQLWSRRCVLLERLVDR